MNIFFFSNICQSPFIYCNVTFCLEINGYGKMQKIVVTTIAIIFYNIFCRSEAFNLAFIEISLGFRRQFSLSYMVQIIVYFCIVFLRYGNSDFFITYRLCITSIYQNRSLLMYNRSFYTCFSEK